MEIMIKIAVFVSGFVVVSLTIFSALSTFVLTRAARSQLNRIVFGIMRRIFEFILKFFPACASMVRAYYVWLRCHVLVARSRGLVR